MSRPVWTPEKALKQNLPQGGRLLLGVSGGVDSITLLHAAHNLSRELRLELEVAHIDHGLRSESSEDAKFVEAAARSLNIPFHLRVLTPPKTGNIEAWGRQERYAFFREIREERALSFTCTAHTADDQAETLLMRLVSNKELKTISRRDEKRKVLRPYLDVSRAAVVEYATKNQLVHREDPTNVDRARLRNKIRHELIPMLEQNFDPRIKEVISNRAVAIAEDSEALDALAASSLSKVVGEFGSKEWMRSVRAALLEVPPAISWRIVEQLFKQKLGFNLGRRRARSALPLFTGEQEGIELPGGLRLARRGGGVIQFPRK